MSRFRGEKCKYQPFNKLLNYHFCQTDSPIVSTGDQIIINLHSISELTCEADANPKPDNFITWSRDGFDLSAHQMEYSEGKAVLRILNVTKADGGLYTCSADNGIVPAFTKNIQVVVQCKCHFIYVAPQQSWHFYGFFLFKKQSCNVFLFINAKLFQHGVSNSSLSLHLH